MVYTYDADGNMISEIGKIGTDKVETYYDYAVENRLVAVYEADELLVAMAYDSDGNRVFQLNYNLHTDEDWKSNSGNGNGSNKDVLVANNASNGNDVYSSPAPSAKENYADNYDGEKIEVGYDLETVDDALYHVTKYGNRTDISIDGEFNVYYFFPFKLSQ